MNLIIKTKKAMKKVQSDTNYVLAKLHADITCAGDVLADNHGLAKSVETVAEIVGAIAVVAVLVAAVLHLFNIDLLPMITQKIKDIFG